MDHAQLQRVYENYDHIAPPIVSCHDPLLNTDGINMGAQCFCTLRLDLQAA